MGSLVPQQINLWMGAARNGTHHRHQMQPQSLRAVPAFVHVPPVAHQTAADLGLTWHGCKAL